MKMESTVKKKRRSGFIAVCVTVLSVLTVTVILLVVRWYRFQRTVGTVSKFYEQYDNVPEEMSEFADYCNSIASGSFEIRTVLYDDEGAYIGVMDVESMDESNEVILAMRGFFSENPDYVLNHRSLKIVMIGDDFYIEYYWDTP